MFENTKYNMFTVFIPEMYNVCVIFTFFFYPSQNIRILCFFFRLQSILSRFDEVLNSGNMALSLSQGKLALAFTIVC